MARANTTDHDLQRVSMACDALLEAGVTPGVRSVQKYLKEHLGGGLNNARVGDLMKRWKDAQPTSTATEEPQALADVCMDDVLDANVDVLPAVEDLVLALGKVLAARGRQEAEERARYSQIAVEVARDEAARRLAELAARHAEALAERDEEVAELRDRDVTQAEEIDRLESARADKAAEVEQWRHQAAVTKSEAADAAEKADRLTASLVAAETRATSAEARVAELEREVDRLRNELMAAQTSAATAKEARAQTASLVDSLRADNKAAQAKNDQLHERVERLTAELAAVTGQADLPDGRNSKTRSKTAGGASAAAGSATA